MNKMYMVALREFVENLRTKTFWIGILAFPVIIVVSIVVSRLLNDSKDVRSYTVIDHSQGEWLSHEIDKRRAMQDYREILREAKAQAENGEPPTAAEMRENLTAALAELDQDHALRPWLETMLEFSDEDLEKMGRREMPSGAAMGKLMSLAMQWSRDPAAAKQLQAFTGGLSIEDYEPVVYDDLGDDPEEFLNQKLQAEDLFAYFVIGEDPIGGNDGFRYVSNNLTDRELRNWYTDFATDVVRERRVAKLKREKNLTQHEADLLRQPVRFDARKVSKTGKSEEVTKTEQASQFAPVAFVYLLWIAVFTAAQMLLTNTVEEKSNRIIEVLLSSVSPLQLMAGKIFGIAATGLTVVGSWVLCAIIGVQLLPLFLGGSIGDLGLTQIIGDPVYLGSFLAYFLAGYFLFAAVLVGLGSVCNSLKEAQNLQQPIVILLIVPLVAMIPVVNDPNGTLARVLTYIPPFTPFLMMNRAAGPPPAWEYVATTILLLVSIVIAFWGAAKIFRIGILMTGKPPKMREILGWLRAPVGAVPHARD